MDPVDVRIPARYLAPGVDSRGVGVGGIGYIEGSDTAICPTQEAVIHIVGIQVRTCNLASRIDCSRLRRR